MIFYLISSSFNFLNSNCLVHSSSSSGKWSLIGRLHCLQIVPSISESGLDIIFYRQSFLLFEHLGHLSPFVVSPQILHLILNPITSFLPVLVYLKTRTNAIMIPAAAAIIHNIIPLIRIIDN